MPTTLDFDLKAMELAERLKALRAKLKLSQSEMAARLRVSKNYVWQVENGTKPGGPKIERDVERMEQGFVAAIPTPPPARSGDILRDVQITVPRYVPVLTLAEAGNVLVAWENLPMHFSEKVPCDFADPKAFAVKVSGDSGETVFFDGDTLLVSPSREVVNGDIVLARLVNGDTLIKLYHESNAGRDVQLASFNPKYPPKMYRRADFEAVVPVVRLVTDISMARQRRHHF